MTPMTHWEGEPVAIWAELWGLPRLDVHATLASTNDEAARLAKEGAAPFTTVLAEQQTDGRGRSGARWYGAAGGSVLLSILVPSINPAAACKVPLVVGVAVARAVEYVAPELSVGIKWPNDVYVGDRKLCGILCESAAGATVVGIGINVRWAAGPVPDDVADRAVSLEEAAGARMSRSALVGRLVVELRAMTGSQGLGWNEDVRRELAGRDLLAGHLVETHRGPGIAEGIDEDGALLVAPASGEILRIVAGSVRRV